MVSIGLFYPDILAISWTKVQKIVESKKQKQRKSTILWIKVHFFDKKRARTCVCQKKVVNLHAILYAKQTNKYV